MIDTSFSEDKGAPPPVANHPNFNYLKDLCENLDNFSHTIFGSKQSYENMRNTTGKWDDVNE